MATYDDFLSALRQRESSGDYAAVNSLGYIGGYQFGEIALIDIGWYTADGTSRNDYIGSWTAAAEAAGVTSKSEFLANSAAQDQAIKLLLAKNFSYIKNLKDDAYVDSTLNGTKITLSGLLGGSHLVGIGGANTYLKSGGDTVPADGNSVPVTSYISLFAGYDTPFTIDLNRSGTILGGSGNDILIGHNGNDTLKGNGGADRIEGGKGVDTAVYDGALASYKLLFNTDKSVTITDPTGTSDVLIDVEKIKFSDITTDITPKQDVAFVIDTTGSMFDDIARVKENIGKILDGIFDPKRGLNSRVSVVGYNDPFTQTLLPFTNQPSADDRKLAASNAINRISVGGGGDIPEKVYSGLLRALNGGAGVWRKDAEARRIFLFGDAPPNDFELAAQVNALAKNLDVVLPSTPTTSAIAPRLYMTSFSAAASSVAGSEAAVPVQIFTIVIGNDASAASSFENIAAESGGASFTSATAAEIVDTLFAVISLPIYSIYASDTAVDEGTDGQTRVTFTVSRDVASGPATITLSAFGDADATDVVTVPTSIRFEDGELSRDIVITITNDTIVERDEVFGLTIETVDEPSTVGVASASLSIVNDDLLDPPKLLEGSDSADVLTDGSQSDTIRGGGGNDTISGLAGDDLLFGQDDDDLVLGGAGNDFGSGGYGSDTLDGGIGNDLLFGDDDNDRVDGGAGDDIVYGGTAGDTLFGSEGVDAVYGEQGNDFIGTGSGDDLGFGGDGNDEVHGEIGNDQLYGGDGIDGVYGEDGNDSVFGGSGDDYLTGDAGVDFVRGENGNDRLFGGEDGDDLSGGAGNDTIEGGTGNDLLFGNSGDDLLTGGAGSDIFGFGPYDGRDIITDFVTSGPEADVIQFNGPDFRSFETVLIALRQDGKDLVITGYGGGRDFIIIKNVQESAISAANFTFT